MEPTPSGHQLLGFRASLPGAGVGGSGRQQSSGSAGEPRERPTCPTAGCGCAGASPPPERANLRGGLTTRCPTRRGSGSAGLRACGREWWAGRCRWLPRSWRRAARTLRPLAGSSCSCGSSAAYIRPCASRLTRLSLLPDTRSRGRPFPARPTPAAVFPEPERSLLSRRLRSTAAARRGGASSPGPGPPRRAPPPERGRRSSSLPKLLQRRQRRTVKRGDGLPARLAGGTRSLSRAAALTICATPAEPGLSSRGGEGSRERSSRLLSPPRSPGLVDFPFWEGSSQQPTGCCAIGQRALTLGDLDRASSGNRQTPEGKAGPRGGERQVPATRLRRRLSEGVW